MKDLRKQYLLQKERKRRHLKNLLEEAIINVLAEQQQPAAEPVQPSPQMSEPLPPPVATPDNQAQESVPPQYTVDDMIDELNSIRGGKSFTDPEIYGKLVTFFKGLTDEQKTNLNSLLSEISELITGPEEEVQAQQQQQNVPAQQTSPPTGGAPQKSAPMPGAQPAAGAAGVGAV